MKNAELINKLRILRGAILNPHHRTGEYVDKRFADVVSDAADALEAAEQRIAELEARLTKEGEWRWNSLLNEYEWVDTAIYCPNCGARMRGEHNEQADC